MEDLRLDVPVDAGEDERWDEKMHNEEASGPNVR
jgi:hypothetical protein